MRLAGLIPLCLFIVALAALPASAQLQVGAEAGLARLRQTGVQETTARTLGLDLGALTDQVWLRSSLLGAFSSSTQATGQGIAAASWFSHARGPLRWELSGSGSVFGETSRRTAYSGELTARALLGSAVLGGAVGVAGGSRRADTDAHGFFHGQANLWAVVKDNRLTAEASLIHTTTEPLMGAGTMGLSYVDLSAGWRTDVGGLSLGANAGGRTTASTRISGGGWGSVDAAMYVARRVAIVASAGQSLEDVVRGVPSTKYVSMGLRLSAQPHATLIPARRRPTTGTQLVIVNQRIEVRVDGASRVELMADFTNWSPIALEGQGGVWRLDRALTPGLHRIAIRVDGGDWMAPANLPHATDDLGGVVGLITIPE